MSERVLRRLREKIRTGQYVMTVHAEEEMDADHLGIFDVEAAALSGRIVERQGDRKTREVKELVRGRALGDEAIEVVVKLSHPSGKMVIVTVYRD